MKDIKSFLIGFLMCACMFLFMGNTSSNSGNGKYQLSTTMKEKHWEIFETIINTQTGKVISRNGVDQGDYKYINK